VSQGRNGRICCCCWLVEALSSRGDNEGDWNAEMTGEGSGGW